MINVIDEIHTYKENDLELFEKARRRVQGKIKGRCVTNKDVIVDQEREIEYYRDKIKKLEDIIHNRKVFNKQFEITINDEEYLIKYNDDRKINTIMLNACLIKLVNEKDKTYIIKDNEFKIINKTRYNKLNTFNW